VDDDCWAEKLRRSPRMCPDRVRTVIEGKGAGSYDFAQRYLRWNRPTGDCLDDAPSCIGGAGTCLVAMSARTTVVHLTAWALAGAAAALVGAVGLQVLYVQPPIVGGWKAFAPKAEQNQLGFRRRPIHYVPEDYVLVLLGDSQVERYGSVSMRCDLTEEVLSS
jgi:hypothetical protein